MWCTSPRIAKSPTLGVAVLASEGFDDLPQGRIEQTHDRSQLGRTRRLCAPSAAPATTTSTGCLFSRGLSLCLCGLRQSVPMPNSSRRGSAAKFSTKISTPGGRSCRSAAAHRRRRTCRGVVLLNVKRRLVGCINSGAVGRTMISLIDHNTRRKLFGYSSSPDLNAFDLRLMPIAQRFGNR